MIRLEKSNLRPISDGELDRICERSEGLCNLDCRRCEAMRANIRWHEING